MSPESLRERKSAPRFPARPTAATADGRRRPPHRSHRRKQTAPGRPRPYRGRGARDARRWWRGGWSAAGGADADRVLGTARRLGDHAAGDRPEIVIAELGRTRG